MFNIHDSPVPKQESTTSQAKSDKKSNPTESTATRGKRKRTSSSREEHPHVEIESSASSLDTGRQPPLLRESSVSAETTTSSLTAMSSTTIPPDSISFPTIASDALGRQLTTIRSIFFTPTTSCTQQTFLMAHESVVKLLADMRLAMYSSSTSFLDQREESIRFVTAIGVVCRVLALKLPWSSPPPDDCLLSPIRDWAPRILRSWEGWIIQFIRIVTCWFDETISPNNILRELSLARLTAPDIPLVKLGGEFMLFEGLTEMLDAFVHFVRSEEKPVEDKQYWGIDVLRACVLLLGDGINFAFIEGAFGPDVEEEEDEEDDAAQTLLDAFGAAQPSGIFHDDDEGSSDDDDDDDDVEEDDDDTFMLRDGDEDGDEDSDEDDESVPFLFFPTRRSGSNHPERRASENVPIVSHRKAYSGHCNVQTVHSSLYNLISRLKMSITTDWTMNT